MALPDADFTPPPAMELSDTWRDISRNAEALIADVLQRGCWTCRGKAARLTRRTIKGKSETIALQCSGCGKQLGNASSKLDHPCRDRYPAWDTELFVANHTAAFNETPAPQAESKVSGFLRSQLTRLEGDRRCVWRAEVTLLGWTHIHNDRPQRLRVDFVARFDNGPLVGLEVKRRPDQVADLGRHLLQAQQYATSMIVGMPGLPLDWDGSALEAVFLAIDRRQMRDQVQEHLDALQRIAGPARVGFVEHSAPNNLIHGPSGLRLMLTGEPWWTERNGYRADYRRAVRSGNGTITPTGRDA